MPRTLCLLFISRFQYPPLIGRKKTKTKLAFILSRILLSSAHNRHICLLGSTGMLMAIRDVCFYFFVPASSTWCCGEGELLVRLHVPHPAPSAWPRQEAEPRVSPDKRQPALVRLDCFCHHCHHHPLYVCVIKMVRKCGASMFGTLFGLILAGPDKEIILLLVPEPPLCRQVGGDGWIEWKYPRLVSHADGVSGAHDDAENADGPIPPDGDCILMQEFQQRKKTIGVPQPFVASFVLQLLWGKQTAQLYTKFTSFFVAVAGGAPRKTCLQHGSGCGCLVAAAPIALLLAITYQSCMLLPVLFLSFHTYSVIIGASFQSFRSTLPVD